MEVERALGLGQLGVLVALVRLVSGHSFKN
jgi:hypothetical protein